MNLYLKNTGATDSFNGLEIASGTYAEIIQTYLNTLIVDDSSMAHVGSGRLVVATSTDGTTDMTVSEGLAALMDQTSKVVHMADPFPDNEGNYSFRGKGGSKALTVGLNNVDVLIHATETRLINGAEVWSDSEVYGDYLSFQVVDVDNVLGYGANFLVEEFGEDWQMFPKGITKAFPGYVAAIPAGLYVRMVVNSSAIADFYYNLHLHKS